MNDELLVMNQAEYTLPKATILSIDNIYKSDT